MNAHHFEPTLDMPGNARATQKSVFRRKLIFAKILRKHLHGLSSRFAEHHVKSVTDTLVKIASHRKVLINVIEHNVIKSRKLNTR